MTSPSLSLGPVLDLIERWQHIRHHPKVDVEAHMLDIILIEKELADIVQPLRALAEQHAAQLRKFAGLDAGRVEIAMLAAADFLAPRREPEAE